MRLTLSLFLISLHAAPLAAQQIGRTDDLLAAVRPVYFCVNLQPETSTQEDLAVWTFPHGAPRPYAMTNDQVTARPGLAFGFELRATGPDSLSDVTIVVDHPPLHDTGATRHSWTADIPVQANALSFYGFGRASEVTPGRWTFSYIKDDRVIYRHVFDLTPANDPNLSCVAAEKSGELNE